MESWFVLALFVSAAIRHLSLQENTFFPASTSKSLNTMLSAMHVPAENSHFLTKCCRHLRTCLGHFLFFEKGELQEFQKKKPPSTFEGHCFLWLSMEIKY